MQRRSRRHTAQDCTFHLHIEESSQLCKHPSWNEWLHGVVLTLSPGSKSHKHIAQATGFPDSKLPSAPSSDHVEAVRPPKTLATANLATSGSSSSVSVTSWATRCMCMPMGMKMQHHAISGIAQDPWKAITMATLATDRRTATAVKPRIKSCRRQHRLACPAIPHEMAARSATITQSDSPTRCWRGQRRAVASSQGLTTRM
mmetsp:Transcript_91753/g.256264  ORF Transcript_91753/g.256264 Transcript_91753/m.256264 type:complete len:201 (-) Transcript_91753:193-795(-)